MFHLQALPLPDQNLSFKLIRRMESLALERSGPSLTQAFHESPELNEALRNAKIGSRLHSLSEDPPTKSLPPDYFHTWDHSPSEPHSDIQPDLSLDQPTHPPDRKGSTLSSVGAHSLFRSLATTFSKTADALEHKPLSIRLYEGTGMKAFVKFLALLTRSIKSGGKRVGSLAVTATKRTGTALKITGQYTLGFALGGVLVTYDGIVGLVRWTGRLGAYAAVGTYKGARKITQLLAWGAIKTTKGAKTAVGAAAKVTTQSTKTVAHATVTGTKKVANLIGEGADKAKLGLASSIAKSGERMTKMGMKTIENAVAKSEKKGKPIKLPEWMRNGKKENVPWFRRNSSFKLKAAQPDSRPSLTRSRSAPL
ncbi:hypothetical protein DFH28DRAFT_1085251 [Melampsora americana]|nr:hypothetical protein DFH28DRAFT_1085251 [Melampsora americana]